MGINSLLGVFSFLFGAILGSFLNALLFRYGTGLGMGGRSRCMRCGHTLSSLDLVPIFSFLVLGGRCRYCKSRISWQYPLVEFIAGLLSLGVFWNLGLYSLFTINYPLFTIFWLTLLFLAVYDLRHAVLPFEGLALLGTVGLFSLFLSCSGSCAVVLPSLWSVAAGPIIGAPLLLLSAISRGRWMGWGDGLLMTAVGWVLGISEGYTALAIAFWSGAIIGLVLIAWSKRKKVTPTVHASKLDQGFTMTSEVPFAPFLILGTALAYFFHVDIFQAIPFL